MATAAPNPLASGDTAYLYRAAIGPRGQEYYLRHFARFDSEGKTGTSWNWAAYWTTFNWLVYRRMWGRALAYVAALIGLALLVFGLGKLVLNYSDTSAILLSLLLLAGAFVVPGLYANAWFHAWCNEKISGVLRKTASIQEAATALAADAPQPRRVWLLALGNVALLGLVLAVLHGFQSAGSSQPLQAREQSGLLQAAASAVAAAPALSASVPAPAANIPKPPLGAASSPSPALATASGVSSESAPKPASPEAAAKVPPAPGSSTASPASGSAMMQTADHGPAPAPRAPEPAVPVRPAAAAPAASTPATAPATPRSATAPRPSPPLLRYVWVIQVGAYAEAENARKALAQVQSLGLDAGSETFGSQPLTRVRVGPFTREDEAEQAALRIKALDLPAQVLRQRP